MSTPDLSTPGSPILWRALHTQFGYHLRLLLRSPRSVITACLIPTLMVFVVQPTVQGPQATGYVVGGSIAFGVIITAFVIHTGRLVTARERGVLKRLRGTPQPAWCYHFGRIIGILTLCLISATVAVVAALDPLEGLHLQLSMHDIPLLVGAILLGGLCWSLMGTALSTIIPSPDAASAVLALIYLPLMAISGVFFPLSMEPEWLQHIAEWLPAAPLATAIQSAFLNPQQNLIQPLIVELVWLAIATIMVIRTFSWLPSDPGKRHATRKSSV